MEYSEESSTSEFYSQNGEDFLLWNLFKGDPEGFYVDIGACDGIYSSSTYFFEQHGWKGVCVEAHPKYYSLCRLNRPKAVCLHNAYTSIGCGPTLSFNANARRRNRSAGSIVGAIGRWLLFNGTERRGGGSAGLKGEKLAIAENAEIEVKTIGLNEILHEYAPVNTGATSFISIDTNGSVIDILKDFDFQKWPIRVFVITANDEAHSKPIIHLMQRNGYTLSRVLSKRYFFARDKETITYLRYKRITCRIADAARPRGKDLGAPNKRELRIEDMSRWITPNILCQQGNQPLWSLLDYFPPPVADLRSESVRIVHVVNPYPASANPESGKLQKLTYDSMRVARDFDGGEITLVSVQHKDDEHLTPEGFCRGRYLDRFVTDLAVFRKPQPLPLLFDIVDRGAELAGPQDFIIYTNSDIILMPFFYSAVRDFIKHGFDAMNICRRTIGRHVLYEDRENLARSEVGDTHPGSDCFVFSREIYSHFIRNNACIGKEGVAKSLLFNMATAAKQMLVLRNVNLTYHIGDDRNWKSPEVRDYAAFNYNELRKIHQELCNIPKRNELLTAFINTYWKWINMQG